MKLSLFGFIVAQSGNVALESGALNLRTTEFSRKSLSDATSTQYDSDDRSTFEKVFSESKVFISINSDSRQVRCAFYKVSVAKHSEYWFSKMPFYNNLGTFGSNSAGILL